MSEIGRHRAEQDTGGNTEQSAEQAAALSTIVEQRAAGTPPERRDFSFKAIDAAKQEAAVAARGAIAAASGRGADQGEDGESFKPGAEVAVSRTVPEGQPPKFEYGWFISTEQPKRQGNIVVESRDPKTGKVVATKEYSPADLAEKQDRYMDALRGTADRARQMGVGTDTVVAVPRSPKPGELSGPVETDWLVTYDKPKDPNNIMVRKKNPDGDGYLFKEVNPSALAAVQPKFSEGSYQLHSEDNSGVMETWQVKHPAVNIYTLTTPSQPYGFRNVSGAELHRLINGTQQAESPAESPAKVSTGSSTEQPKAGRLRAALNALRGK